MPGVGIGHYDHDSSGSGESGLQFELYAEVTAQDVDDTLAQAIGRHGGTSNNINGEADFLASSASTASLQSAAMRNTSTFAKTVCRGSRSSGGSGSSARKSAEVESLDPNPTDISAVVTLGASFYEGGENSDSDDEYGGSRAGGHGAGVVLSSGAMGGVQPCSSDSNEVTWRGIYQTTDKRAASGRLSSHFGGGVFALRRGPGDSVGTLRGGAVLRLDWGGGVVATAPVASVASAGKHVAREALTCMAAHASAARLLVGTSGGRVLVLHAPSGEWLQELTVTFPLALERAPGPSLAPLPALPVSGLGDDALGVDPLKLRSMDNEYDENKDEGNGQGRTHKGLLPQQQEAQPSLMNEAMRLLKVAAVPRNGCRTPVTCLHVVADTAKSRASRGQSQQVHRGHDSSFVFSSFVHPHRDDVARFDLLVSSALAGTVQALELPSGAILGCCANHSGGENPDPIYDEVSSAFQSAPARRSGGGGGAVACLAWSPLPEGAPLPESAATAYLPPLATAGAYDQSVMVWDFAPQLSAPGGPDLSTVPVSSLAMGIGAGSIAKPPPIVGGDYMHSLDHVTMPAVVLDLPSTLAHGLTCVAADFNNAGHMAGSSGTKEVNGSLSPSPRGASSRLLRGRRSLRLCAPARVEVTAMSYSADGVYLACGDKVGDVRIYRLAGASPSSVHSSSPPVLSRRNPGHGGGLLEAHVRTSQALPSHLRPSVSDYKVHEGVWDKSFDIRGNISSGRGHHMPQLRSCEVQSLSWSRDGSVLAIAHVSGLSLAARRSANFGGGLILQTPWKEAAVDAGRRLAPTPSPEHAAALVVQEPPLDADGGLAFFDSGERPDTSSPPATGMRTKKAYATVASPATAAAKAATSANAVGHRSDIFVVTSGIPLRSSMNALKTPMPNNSESVHCFLARHLIPLNASDARRGPTSQNTESGMFGRVKDMDGLYDDSTQTTFSAECEGDFDLGDVSMNGVDVKENGSRNMKNSSLRPFSTDKGSVTGASFSAISNRTTNLLTTVGIGGVAMRSANIDTYEGTFKRSLGGGGDKERTPNVTTNTSVRLQGLSSPHNSAKLFGPSVAAVAATGARWKTVGDGRILGNGVRLINTLAMVYKLDAPCIGIASHESSLDSFLVALTAHGTVVLYQTWTGELRGVFGCTAHPGDRTMAHVHVDPSGLYVGLAASQDVQRSKKHKLRNMAKLMTGGRGQMPSTTHTATSSTAVEELPPGFGHGTITHANRTDGDKIIPRTSDSPSSPIIRDSTAAPAPVARAENEHGDARKALPHREAISIKWAAPLTHVEVYQLLTGKRAATLGPFPGGLRDFRWAPSGRHLALATGRGVQLYKIPSGLASNIHDMQMRLASQPAFWRTYPLYIPPLPKTSADIAVIVQRLSTSLQPFGTSSSASAAVAAAAPAAGTIIANEALLPLSTGPIVRGLEHGLGGNGAEVCGGVGGPTTHTARAMASNVRASTSPRRSKLSDFGISSVEEGEGAVAEDENEGRSRFGEEHDLNLLHNAKEALCDQRDIGRDVGSASIETTTHGALEDYASIIDSGVRAARDAVVAGQSKYPGGRSRSSQSPRSQSPRSVRRVSSRSGSPRALTESQQEAYDPLADLGDEVSQPLPSQFSHTREQLAINSHASARSVATEMLEERFENPSSTSEPPEDHLTGARGGRDRVGRLDPPDLHGNTGRLDM